MRHLATVQRILALDPIEGADAIEVASVLGWKCVVKKGEFQVGDPCVYIEVDSLLPDRPEFEFMKPRGMRVRTVRLRGQVSQGLALPTSILKGDARYWAEPGIGFCGDEGDDVTEALDITKYEAPIPAQLAGEVRGLFPAFLKKTDEDRIQQMPDLLQKFPDTRCRVCEKLDGSSATFYFINGEFGVCSRNLDLKETEGNTFWKVAREMDLETKMRGYGRNIALQGELVGEGVQKNKYGLKGQTVYFFDVFSIDGYYHMGVLAAESVVNAMGLKMVPFLGDIERLGDETVDSLVEKATRKSTLKPDVWAEGIVVRSYQEMTETFITNKTVNRGRISFKSINPQFLLKYDE